MEYQEGLPSTTTTAATPTMAASTVPGCLAPSGHHEKHSQRKPNWDLGEMGDKRRKA